MNKEQILELIPFDSYINFKALYLKIGLSEHDFRNKLQFLLFKGFIEIQDNKIRRLK